MKFKHQLAMLFAAWGVLLMTGLWIIQSAGIVGGLLILAFPSLILSLVTAVWMVSAE